MIDDPGDYITSDEGREVDWDSHLSEPRAFFTEAEPCESCGRPCESRRPAEWDESISVGPCCEFSFDIPELANCPDCKALMEAVYQCRSVFQVRDTMAAHIACPVCQGKTNAVVSRRPAGSRPNANGGEMERAA